MCVILGKCVGECYIGGFCFSGCFGFNDGVSYFGSIVDIVGIVGNGVNVWCFLKFVC